MISLQGDESTCKQTKDANGASCEWCTVGTSDLCLNSDQVQIAEQVGASCGDDSLEVEDPYDPSCIMISLQGDEAMCKQTKDADGASCEWCSVGTTELCLNGDQAQIAEQIGGSCGDDTLEVEDPYDPSCIAVTMNGDESSCKQTKDADGASCEWCTVGSTELCLNSDQAQIAEQIGGSCDSSQSNQGLLSAFF
mmetsp:Transcript_4435/g.7886  ORF Transcript_4435/g.7886 Transcript_4435/m.7886 type:complete len:194 (+) Transcript_4435:1-582(+)